MGSYTAGHSKLAIIQDNPEWESHRHWLNGRASPDSASSIIVLESRASWFDSRLQATDLFWLMNFPLAVKQYNALMYITRPLAIILLLLSCFVRLAVS